MSSRPGPDVIDAALDDLLPRASAVSKIDPGSKLSVACLVAAELVGFGENKIASRSLVGGRPRSNAFCWMDRSFPRGEASSPRITTACFDIFAFPVGRGRSTILASHKRGVQASMPERESEPTHTQSRTAP